MKTILLLSIAFLFLSCSKEEIQDCDCVRELWEHTTYNLPDGNGGYIVIKEDVFLNSREVSCQDEVDYKGLPDRKFYKVICN